MCRVCSAGTTGEQNCHTFKKHQPCEAYALTSGWSSQLVSLHTYNLHQGAVALFWWGSSASPAILALHVPGAMVMPVPTYK